ncbi:MAG: hypothetical protein HKN78_09200 [Sphingomonadaceae bacterium]|nr:hypothetical protein [Sphingomonadaceae bacterium]
MSTWILGSEEQSDGSRDVTIDFQNDDSTGQMGGTLVFKGKPFFIKGAWAASGSIPGRNYSAFSLWGSDQQDATEFVAVAGTMDGPGSAPQSISMNLIRVSTGDDEQYGWDGVLKPM